MSNDSKVMQVVGFTGCTEEVARQTLEIEEWDVISALDRLTNVPKVSGTKYVPSKPKVSDNLTPEVRSKIEEARKLADMLTFAPQNDLRGKASHYPSASQEQK